MAIVGAIHRYICIHSGAVDIFDNSFFRCKDTEVLRPRQLLLVSGDLSFVAGNLFSVVNALANKALCIFARAPHTPPPSEGFLQPMLAYYMYV